MAKWLSVKGNVARLQMALNAALKGKRFPHTDKLYEPLQIDDKNGNLTGDALWLYKYVNGITPVDDILDNATRDRLGLGVDLVTKPGTLANTVATAIVNVVLVNLLKGTGIQMDFSKISKAIAGLFAGAGAAGGSAAYAYISLPANVQAVLPSWVAPDITIVNTIIGAIVGFALVYFAPANKPS